MPKTASSAVWPARLLGVVLAGVVLALTLGFEVARPQLLPGQDKLEHLVAFLGLGLLFGWGSSAHAIVFGMALLGGAAFGIEAGQNMLPFGREGAMSDALAGVAGACVGLLAAFILSLMARAFSDRSQHVGHVRGEAYAS